MTWTAGIFLPSSFVISPRCTISGKWRFVIEIASGMISLAQTGVIPCLLAASGNTPIPSNKLPSVIVMSGFLPVWLSLTYIALSGGEWC